MFSVVMLPSPRKLQYASVSPSDRLSRANRYIENGTLYNVQSLMRGYTRKE